MGFSDRTFVYVANAFGGGISIYRLHCGTGNLDPLGSVDAESLISPLTVSPDRRYLYACLRGDAPAVLSFAIDSRTGGLERLGSVPAVHASAHVSVDAGGRFLFSASYHGGGIAVYPIGRAGWVQGEPATVLHPGRNPHFILADPSNRFVYVPCLGSGHISQFLFDEKTGELTPNRPAAIAARFLAGPRHFCYAPNNRFVYALTELSGEVVCYALDAATGVLSEKQYISFMPADSTLPPEGYVPPNNARAPGAKPKIWGADIHVTPDGRFVYASERSSSIISCFSCDTPTGTLAYLGSFETETQPRSFAICPKSRHIVAAGEKSDQVSVHAIDRDTGTLTRLGRYPAGKNPNWVEIVDFR